MNNVNCPRNTDLCGGSEIGVGIGASAEATGTVIGGAAGSCWDDFEQDTEECMKTNVSMMVISAAAGGTGIAKLGSEIGELSAEPALRSTALPAAGGAEFGLTLKGLAGC